ncbi:MAG: molybdenum ABC transporter ATP-binding protein [Gammaproteobacteria bacterium]|nr:molybdenum ABC transporter ATP-binding protein [Gammaproteobacteria bacterium]
MNIHARVRIAHPGFDLDVDLHLPGRGVSALFGVSGSGKTTCLRAIAGLERTSARVSGSDPGNYLDVNGAVWQDDAHGVFLPTHRRPLGYVFQEASLFAHLSVRENLEYGRKRAARDARSVDLPSVIDLLGIDAVLDRMPDRLSGGERQRVAIARALLTRPHLLLMDEPLAALDLARKQEILPYLQRLHDALEIPLIYVSHAPDEVAQLADHLVVLEQGRVLASGPLSETLARLDLPIRLGEDTGVVLEGAVAERDAHWHLARIAFSGDYPDLHVWVRDSGVPLGQRVRVRILARDISLALETHSDSSILNALPATVDQIAADTHPALALVRLNAGGVPLVARVTQRSAANLQLHPGQKLWAQIKAVALVG